MTALIITTYNRPEYLLQCLDSIMALTEFPELLIIVDDASDLDTKKILYDYDTLIDHQRHLYKSTNLGIKDSLEKGFTYAFKHGAELVINLDGDAIVKPNFITRLKELHTRYPDHICSGFNCDNPKNPILYEAEDYVLRNHCNGINMCFNRRQYEQWIMPALLREGNWDFNSTHNLPFVISKPSVVQHIGLESSMGHVNPDIACDYD